ncbi:hypothetical protein ElyMa_005753400 [Elysia marginata]|uniref:Uncharacterized protein n=1 Tax=Elysia marginata TaxID=1093978 RepID=A0AAV4FPS8_9GAST|nr:hypothetical protein ElyMa_005753400 [Elysia marginata]
MTKTFCVFSAKSTFRKDPFKTAYKWRQDLPFSLIIQVDEACRDLYSLLGYETFNRKDHMRNMQIPAKRPSYGEGLMKASLP